MTIGQNFDSVLEAAQEGAGWAWGVLYRDLAPQVFGYLRAQGSAEPEDLLGEVFLQVARNIGRFRGNEAAFRSWVFLVAHHRVVDERRFRGRRSEELVAVDQLEGLVAVEDSEQVAMRNFSTERVQELLDQLTPAQRDVLTLRIVGGLTVAETAQIVGKRVGAVRALQRRGLAVLRRKLQEGVLI